MKSSSSNDRTSTRALPTPTTSYFASTKVGTVPSLTTLPCVSEATHPEYRLPRTVVPRRYALSIEPDLDAATFTGREDVEVDVRKAVREIVFNAVDRDLERASVIDAGG